MSNFKYSDAGDKLTEELIAGSFDGAYWGRSEAGVLSSAKELLARRFGPERLKGARLLDLGCGMGRLIPEFAALVGDVTGLEPDEERCAAARALLAAEDVQNARALPCTLGEYLAQAETPPRFDAVLCSHIFQHFSHDTFRGILRDLRRCTGQDTVFIFTTTYTHREENLYSAEFFENGRRVSRETDLPGFEQAVRDDNVLAVCRFSRPWLTAFFRENGLTVADFCCYHFQDEHDESRDRANTEDPEKRPLARDALYLCLPGPCWTEAAFPGQETLTAAGKVCFMRYYFCKSDRPDIRPLEALDAAQAASDRRARVQADFATAEGFLYGAGLHFPARRCVLSEVSVRLDGVPISDSHAIVTAYPESALCQVSVCLTVEDTPIQDFIFLHQIQCSPAPFFRIDGEKTSITALCDRLLAEAGFPDAKAGSTAIITELNRLGDRASAEEPLTDQECRCLYGVLVGDEGWQHVPISLARSRVDSCWTSRDFVRAIVFSNNFVLLNLNRGRVHGDYLASQHAYADRYFGGLNDYFTMDASTAGVNHGLFFSVETAMLIKTTADRLLDNRPDLTVSHGMILRDEIKRNKRYRAEMIRVLNKVEMVNISELGELDAMIVQSLSAEKRIESIRALLELLESDLDLLYQTNTNRMVNMLTVLGLILAAVQVILGIVPIL